MTIKTKRILIVIVAVAVLALIFWPKSETENVLTATARMAPFENIVASSGELLAENSQSVTGPEGLHRYRMYDIKLLDIIPEGTYVKKGDYIAELDKSELNNRINDTRLDVDKAESQYTQIKLDTALTLRDARDNIQNLIFQLEQNKLVLEQSQYEPPATIKQAEINVDKSKRNVEQAQENYKIKKKQAEARMTEAATNLQQSRNRLTDLMDVQAKFRIFAPEDGIVIYKRGWGGDKVKTGSQVSAWDPIVAELPDLSVLLSKTFINEVDINKVRVGQKVRLSLDAFPDAKLTGEVTEVANMGEKRKNDDSKVFEVVIKVAESDSIYRPGMTTSNKIVTSASDSVLLAPIESVFGENEKSWVYVKNGMSITKQEVKTGEANDVDVIILAGIKPGDELLLSEPKDAADLPLKPAK